MATYQQKSQEVTYGFGQLCSAITDGANAIYPPHGMVITAITALADTTFHATSGLVSEVQDNSESHVRFITTEDSSGTSASAHEIGEFTAQNAHNDNGSNATGVITLAAANKDIKQGMMVVQSTMCPRSVSDPYIVKSISGTTLTVTKKSTYDIATAVASNLADSSAAAIYFFAQGGQGEGGLEMDASDSIPKGVTIYGRWTSAKLSAGGAGRIICYFGY